MYANGHLLADYCETVIQQSLNAAFGLALRNANADYPNLKAVDHLNPNRTLAVQATRAVSKAKVEGTIALFKSERTKAGSPLENVTELHIVGLECAKPSMGTQVLRLDKDVTVKTYSLLLGLDVRNLASGQLDAVERVFHGLTTVEGLNLHNDKEEVKEILRHFDRPALHDSRGVEGNWSDMLSTMKDLRRLIARGTDAAGRQITRPYSTFEPKAQALLKHIYDLTSGISRAIAATLASANPFGQIDLNDAARVDVYRISIQRDVSALAAEFELNAPRWGTPLADDDLCPTCGQSLP
ncbi:hypothetical protein GCM10017602_35170 [Herbiconiux flava]|nr:hypothetical protein GCM10017602_35170 [Herbiconiux flava]